MTTSNLSPQEILALPMIPNDADAKTVHEYIIRMSEQLWIEEEGFSGKRPFGNSGWQHELYGSLVKGGAFPGEWDDGEWTYSGSAYSSYEIDNEDDTITWKDLEALVRSLFTFLRSADPLSIQLPPEPKEWAVIALDVDEIVGDTLEDFSMHIYTEEEAEKELEKCKKNSPDFTWIKVKLPSYK